MFGAIVSGRPVQTNLVQVDENKFAFQIEDGASVNHIVVFLLPGANFEPGMAASIYFQWPGRPFQFLGGLANNKQSAIFKVKQTNNDPTEMNDSSPVTITLGISIEPIGQVESQMQSLGQHNTNDNSKALTTQKVSPNSIAVLGNKIIQNAYNYLSGFTTPEGLVPIRVFDDWWRKFGAKLQNNPDFLNEPSD